MLNQNDAAVIIEHQGYTIRPKHDLPQHMRDQEAWVVTDASGLVNVMPGATWFRTREDAMKGISALTVTKAIVSQDNHEEFARVFWSLIRLAGFNDKPLEGQRAVHAQPRVKHPSFAEAFAHARVPTEQPLVYVHLHGATGSEPSVRGPYAHVSIEEGGVVEALTPTGQAHVVATLDFESGGWLTEGPDGQRTDWAGIEITTNPGT